MPRLVHLVRHGQSTFNAHYSATGIDPIHFDARLTELGRRQVAEAREQLATYDYDVVLVSPLTRAIQTAEGIFGGRAPLEITPLHREWQVSSCDIGRSTAELVEEFPHLNFGGLPDPWWLHDGPPCELGFPQETEEHLGERLAAFRAMILDRPEQRIAAVGHGDFFSRLVGRHLQNCEMAEWDPKGPIMPRPL